MGKLSGGEPGMLQVEETGDCGSSIEIVVDVGVSNCLGGVDGCILIFPLFPRRVCPFRFFFLLSGGGEVCLALLGLTLRSIRNMRNIKAAMVMDAIMDGITP
jgi:hypothetical protein